MDADEPFESPKLLIARAKENLEDFDGRYKAFLEGRPYETVTEDDPKSSDKILKIRMTQNVPPMMRGVLSDALNNMRHALDQAVNDSAVLLRAGKRDCYFPFGRTAADFALIYESKRYKTIPVDLRPHLNSLEPYFGGNDVLNALGKLSGPNKHQVVLRIVGGTEDGFSGRNIQGHGFSFVPAQWDPTKRELPIMRIHPGGEVKADFSFAPLIALDHPAARGLKLASGLSDEFMRIAEGVVLGIEAETARLLRERDNRHGDPLDLGPVAQSAS